MPDEPRPLARQQITLLESRRQTNPPPGLSACRSVPLVTDRLTILPRPATPADPAKQTALPMVVARRAAELADELATLMVTVEPDRQTAMLSAFISRLIQATRTAAIMTPP
jgi:hypothetical protein